MRNLILTFPFYLLLLLSAVGFSQTTAIKSDNFVERIGFNTHFN